jgi:hypothetical protein
MGGFFDEDNNRFEWTALVLVFLLLVYVGSFVLLRSENTFPCEEDGCSYERVEFPGGFARTVYAPLINWDKMLYDVRYDSDG